MDDFKKQIETVYEVRLGPQTSPNNYLWWRGLPLYPRLIPPLNGSLKIREMQVMNLEGKVGVDNKVFLFSGFNDIINVKDRTISVISSVDIFGGGLSFIQNEYSDSNDILSPIYARSFSNLSFHDHNTHKFNNLSATYGQGATVSVRPNAVINIETTPAEFQYSQCTLTLRVLFEIAYLH